MRQLSFGLVGGIFTGVKAGQASYLMESRTGSKEKKRHGAVKGYGRFWIQPQWDRFVGIKWRYPG